MNILDLPPELLGRVIEFSMPLDFEHLMMTCRAVYACGRSRIALHNARKREWAKIDIDIDENASAVLECLHKMMKDPIVAGYVEDADFRGNRIGFSPSAEESLQTETAPFRVETASIEDMEGFLDQRLYSHDTGLPASLWNAGFIKECLQQADNELLPVWSFMFLLSQLKNIKSLTLPRSWDNAFVPDYRHEESAQRRFLESIMRLSNQTRPHSPWARLKTLRLLGLVDYDTRIGLSTLAPFLAMKGLQELYATSLVAVDDGYTGIPFTWLYPDLKSSLQRVELVSCCMDAQSVSSLVANTPLLRVFRYSQQTKWHGCEHDWNPANFVAALGRHCGHHLTDLAITIDEVYGDIINGVTSLREFTCLERVELELAIFAGPSLESGERKGMEENPPATGYKLWETRDVPKLVEMLPASLRSLRLFNNCIDRDEYIDVALALLKDFSAGRDWLLSNLEEISYRQRLVSGPEPVELEGLHTVKKHAEAIGAEYLAGDYIQPVWKKAFGNKHGVLASPD
ncbi:hypothetical protein SCUP234_01865 [Seiridium cupressi]